MLRLFFLALVLGMSVNDAGAASQEGQYALKGIGRESCQDFDQQRTQGSEKYKRYGAWLSGYISAVNKLGEDTVDVAPWQSMDVIAAYVTNFCQRNADMKVVEALDAVISILWANRLVGRTELIKADTDDGAFEIYASVLRQVQEVLAEQSLLAGPPSGEFDVATETALRAFQEQRALPVTGLPDQTTLYLLLTP